MYRHLYSFLYEKYTNPRLVAELLYKMIRLRYEKKPHYPPLLLNHLTLRLLKLFQSHWLKNQSWLLFLVYEKIKWFDVHNGYITCVSRNMGAYVGLEEERGNYRNNVSNTVYSSIHLLVALIIKRLIVKYFSHICHCEENETLLLMT